METHKKNYIESAKKVVEIRRILCNNNNNEFAERLGITPQTASNLARGYSGIGKVTAEKILTAFPEVSPAWLLKGEGAMFITDNGSQVINGDGNHHNTNNSVSDRLLAIIETDQRERLELLEIIKNLTAR